MKQPASIVVIGAGAFGTALATVIARQHQPVTLLGRNHEQMQSIQRKRTNETALPGIMLPDELQATADPRCLEAADIILFVMPSQAIRAAARTYRGFIAPDARLILCAKGMEQSSGLFLDRVIAAEMPDNPVAVLSGPGFAADIAKGLPTAMTIASTDRAIAESLARSLSGSTFRLYASDDVVGVEIAGALKNVIAIACGIVEGRGLGESAKAALIARGLAELMRFATAHGGRPETVAGLSGLGDLVLTATSRQSRNLNFGLALGKGSTPEQLMAPGAPLSEGAYTASVAAQISREKHIDMPITNAVSSILLGNLGVDSAIGDLMTRPLKSE